ncbi:MAG: proton-conducting transporter membrane subunit [Chloroflexota bacterium]
MHYEKAGRVEYALLSFLYGLFGLSVILLIWQIIVPQPINVPGITIDRLSASITLLVAGVGAVSYRFALRYLDGEPRQQQFLRWLAFTVASAYILMPATNLLLLFSVWLLTSFGLHQLLTFYQERSEAFPPARKKFLISRLGDVALLAAIGLIGLGWGTLDLHVFLSRVTESGVWPFTPTVVALLIVTAALTKSAQFPFHSWLPETMEAPTPVSALMHAGIINAGGVLLLHFAPLLVTVPVALLMLAFVGTLTAMLGLLAMWAQTNIKRSLAWSTVSQMGFMMLQFGMAAFPAAILHLLGHGCYKAWSFLRTGDLPRHSPTPPTSPMRSVVMGILGTLIAVPALWLGVLITGFDPFQSPGKFALTFIVALAIGQVWIAIFRTPTYATSNTLSGSVIALITTVVVAIFALGLYQGAEIFYMPVWGEVPIATGPVAWAAAALPILGFTFMVTLYTLLPIFSRTAMGRAFYVHAIHGFYFGAIADRLVERIWNNFAVRRVEHA